MHKTLLLLAFSLSLLCSFTIAQQQLDTPLPTINEYEKLIRYYRYYKPDSAVYFANLAMEMAEQQQDSTGKAIILLQEGMIKDNEGDFKSSEQKYQEALTLFSSLDDQEGIAKATIRIGVVALRNGNYDQATEHFLEALKISEGIRDTAGMAEANYQISWAHLDHHDEEKALHYLKLAHDFNSRIPFSSLTLNIYNHFGVLYTKFKDYEQAKYYLEQGIPLSNSPEFQGLYITLSNNLANVYALEGNVDKAVNIQMEALSHARAMNNYLRELQVLSGLFKSLRYAKPVEAESYIKQAITLASEHKASKQQLRYYKMLTDFYKSRGDFQNAFLSIEQEYALADSVFHSTMSQNIEALKAEYALSKSQAKVEELNFINRSRALELEKSEIFRNLILAGLGVLLIILGLLYNQYRLKQKAHQEISSKNISLQLLLNEKEWLLKEIHHRVKNNLQIVMSLLNTQSAYLDNGAALTAIRESQHRMQAMSLIHQKLYQTDNISTIHMTSYIRELVHYLQDSYDLSSRVRFNLHIEAIELDVAEAVPLGLILNEAITNAIKYAFPDQQTGIITIEMQYQAEDLMLTITDNGVGLPSNFEEHQRQSLGMSLMQGLSRQIKADFKLESKDGLRISLLFKTKKLFMAASGVSAAEVSA